MDIIGTYFIFRIFGKSRYLSWVALLPVILYALVIIVGDKLYRKLAAFLNDLENYRTEEDYENFLINKIVIFQCVSAFGSLFYIGFYLRNMKRLQETLATLLITRQVIQNVLETAVPFVTDKLKFSRLTYRMTRSMSDTTLRRHVTAVREKRQSESVSDEPPTTPDEMNSPPLLRHRRAIDGQRVQPSFMVGQVGSPHRSPRLPFPEFYPEFHPTDETEPELTQAELEALMSTYERPLDDYLEMFIQFGYVLLFSPAFPLAGLCALANNLFEIRVDAFKLCNTVQRPFGRPVRDIGSWQRAMEVMGVVGVMVNCALIGQSGLVHRLWPDLSWGGQILIVVVLEHIILAAKFALDFAIPDTPEWVRIETAKVEHWRREAFNRESKFLTMEKRDSSPAIVSRERSGTSTAAKPPVTKTPFFHKKRSITPSAPRYHIRDTEL
uniref:Anoctamin n=1 Tax=Plectus sambesii TaxID=2011161 RepID=A0A914W4H8_9BILA